MQKTILVLAIALLLLSCDDKDVETNPFIGTWIATSGYHDVFTKNTITVYDTSGNIYWKAAYTYDDINITATVDAALSHPEMVATLEAKKGLIPYYFQDGYLFFNYVRLEKCDYQFTPSP